VAEKILQALADHEAAGGLDEEVSAKVEALLASLVDALRDHLYDYIMDR
jgi:hypothetical protein